MAADALAPYVTRSLAVIVLHSTCINFEKTIKVGSCLAQLIVAQWLCMASENLVNIGSGNGLLPDSTKPLPEPVLT